MYIKAEMFSGEIVVDFGCKATEQLSLVKSEEKHGKENIICDKSALNVFNYNHHRQIEICTSTAIQILGVVKIHIHCAMNL